jgi:hypothetical protein
MNNAAETRPVAAASAGALLSQALTQAGPVVLVDAGLIGSAEAMSLQRTRGPTLDAAERRGLHLLDAATGEGVDPDSDSGIDNLSDNLTDSDAGIGPDATPLVQPAWLSLFEAALQTASPPWAVLSQPLPWAAWTARAEGLSPAPHEHWMQLLPCRVSLTAQAVGLVPLAADAFTEAQVQSMTPLVASWPARLVRAPSGSVFLCAQESFGLRSSPPASLTGLHLAHHLPIGPRSTDWRRLSSEIEMAFFSLANEDTDAAETLWPWGAGALPAVASPTAAPPGNHLGAPKPMVGMLAWLEAQGLTPRILWQQAEDLDGWTHAWRTAFKTIAEADEKKMAWTLIATQGTQARLWSSLAPTTGATGLKKGGWVAVLRALLSSSRRRGAENRGGDDWQTWIRLATRADLTKDSPSHG